MINIVTVSLIIAGLFFFIATSVGVLRLPDFYSRMHAAGQGDVLASLLILLGLGLYNLHHFSLQAVLVSIKIGLIYLFILIASPTATHAIIYAGFESGIKPWKRTVTDEEEDDLAT